MFEIKTTNNLLITMIIDHMKANIYFSVRISDYYYKIILTIKKFYLREQVASGVEVLVLII